MNEPLLEGRDYTLENGRMVFTAHFLRKRGTCCNSGCRHCPYRGDASVAPGCEIVVVVGPKK
jgi:uncharacterized protein DUF5522